MKLVSLADTSAIRNELWVGLDDDDFGKIICKHTRPNKTADAII